MELKQLRQFVVIAEKLSFRAAADELCMAQPPLSVSIRKLEDGIGFALFTRTSRDVQLTPAGREILPIARRCLDAAREFATVGRDVDARGTQLLRIGMTPSATRHIGPAIVQRFARANPCVRINLRAGTNDEQFHALLTGHMDMGFVRVPSEIPPSLQHAWIEHDTLCLAVPLGHPLAGEEGVSLRVLRAERFIGYPISRTNGLYLASAAAFAHHGFEPLMEESALQVQALLALVASGLGIGLVPRRQADGALQPNCRYVTILDLPPSSRIGIAIVHRPLSGNDLSKRFVDVVFDLHPHARSAYA